MPIPTESSWILHVRWVSHEENEKHIKTPQPRKPPLPEPVGGDRVQREAPRERKNPDGSEGSNLEVSKPGMGRGLHSNICVPGSNEKAWRQLGNWTKKSHNVIITNASRLTSILEG